MPIERSFNFLPEEAPGPIDPAFAVLLCRFAVNQPQQDCSILHPWKNLVVLKIFLAFMSEVVLVDLCSNVTQAVIASDISDRNEDRGKRG